MSQSFSASSFIFLVLISGACGPGESTQPAAEPTPSSATIPAPEIIPPPETPRQATKIEIPNAMMPEADVLTGGQPSEEQLEEAARAGYRTVVNLRGASEEIGWDEEAKATHLGLTYVGIPIAGSEQLTAENARKLAEILTDENARPIMVHCASGNRVGALFALKAFHVDGETPEAALRVGRAAGLTRLEGAVKERLSAAE